jgi:hypothetical protein
MPSWKLIRYFTPFWESDTEPPLVAREARRPSIWSAAAMLLAMRGVIPALGLIAAAYVCGTALARNPIATLCFSNLLILLIVLPPSLAVWSLPLGLALGPVIVREREQGTWTILRATPIPTEAILLSKARGGTAQIDALLRLARGAILCASAVAGLISLYLVERLVMAHRTAFTPLGACGAGGIVILTAGALFALDRAQQFVLMAVAALAVSASATTTRMALPGAMVTAFGVWLADVSVAAMLLALQPGNSDVHANAILLTTLGPLAGYLAAFDPLPAVGLIAGTFAVREIAVRLVWRWTVRAARAI